jgi:hypothetical protein
VAKKKTAPRKAKASRAKTRKKSVGMSGDTSRLDTGPLQDHIRKRIKELEGKAARVSARQAEDDTLERLKMALETLEDICFPSMTVPI